MKPSLNQPARSAARAVLRALLGLACLSSLAPAVLIAASEGVDWLDFLDIAGELRDFFGNWTAPCMVLGFAISLALFGAFLLVETGFVFPRRHGQGIVPGLGRCKR